VSGGALDISECFRVVTYILAARWPKLFSNEKRDSAVQALTKYDVKN
jgi:hypothetical protein